MSKAVLVLEDGSVFYGKQCGEYGTTVGEICFNTGMTGYQEIFTDPSYFGQIIIMNSVHIGNYGLMINESESKQSKISGLICRNYEKTNSRSASISLNAGMENVVGICDIDTRTLVSHIRSKGAMNCIISSDDYTITELKNMLKNHPKMSGRDLSLEVTTNHIYKRESNGDYHVVVYDFGVKDSILRTFYKLGISTTIVPANTKFEDLPECDGYFLSNGPGDPSSMSYAIENTKKIIDSNKPVFGICLGHQLIALANGAKTFKMKNGHRGSNHPVKNLIHFNQGCEITTQNHGFCVDSESVKKTKMIVTHVHLNDETVAGLMMLDKPVFSVQYHPEAGPGPNDSKYLFNQFLDLLCREIKK